MAYLPVHCNDSTRVSNGEAICRYVSTARNPRGGDLPGAKEGRVAWIVLNRKGRRANVVDDVFSDELQAAVEASVCDKVDLIVVLSEKEGFCVGADIDLVYEAMDYTKMRASLLKAVTAFEALENAGIPTLSVLHGACLGGGYELALHTTIRCISRKNTSIGLPEVKLGLIPGAGGVIKLPQLLGLATAADLILKGTVLPGMAAYENRMADFLLPDRTSSAAYLELDQLAWDIIERSPTVVLRRGCTKRDDWLESTVVGIGGLQWFSKQAIDKQVKQRFAAPYVALSTLLACRYCGPEVARQKMVDATAALAVGSDAKAFMRLWKANRDVGKMMKKQSCEGKGLVVVCKPSGAAAVLSLALKKENTFCLICGQPVERILTVDHLEETLGKKSEKYLSRLQHTGTFADSGVPTPSGYDVVVILIAEDGNVPEEEMKTLANSSDKDNWLWMAPKGIQTPCTKFSFTGAFYVGKTGVVADLVLDDSHELLQEKLSQMGSVVVATKEGIVNIIEGLVARIVLTAGLEPRTLAKALNLKPETFIIENGEGQPVSTANPSEKTKRFICTLCEQILTVIEKIEWVTPDIVDYLFVMCFGWEPRVSGPFLVVQQKGYAADVSSEYPHLRDHVAAAKSLKERPDVEKIVWKHAKAFYPTPGLRDVVWPALLFGLYKIVTLVAFYTLHAIGSLATMEMSIKRM